MARSTNNVVSPLVVDVNDALMASGLTVTYPYPSRLKLVASSSLTQGGALSVTFTGGDPEEGEQLDVVVHQPAYGDVTRHGLIQGLVLSGATFSFGNESDYDQYSVDPHYGLVTTMSFQFSERYMLLATSVHSNVTDESLLPAIHGHPYGYGENPQTARRALAGPWLQTSQTSADLASGPSSNPVWVSELDMVFWVAATGDATETQFRSKDGTITQASATGNGDTIASNGNPLVYLPLSSKAYHLCDDRIKYYSFGKDPVSGVPSATNLGISLVTPLGGLLSRARDTFIYLYDNGNYIKIDDSLSVKTMLVSITGTYKDAAKTPEGCLAVLTSSDIDIAKQGHGISLGPGDFTNTSHGLTNVEALTWDKANARWIVSTSGSPTKFFHSTDLDASAWVEVGSLPPGATAVPNRLLSVGSALVCTTFNLANAPVVISLDGGATWVDWSAPNGSAGYDNIMGFVGHAGKLLCTVTQSSNATLRLIEALTPLGPWGETDAD